MLVEKAINTKWPLFLVWFFLTSATPFIMYAWPWHPHKKLIFVLLGVMSIQLYYKRCVSIPSFSFPIFSTLLFLNIWMLLFFTNAVYVNILLQIFSIILLHIYISTFVGYSTFVKSFVYVMLFMAIGGFIMFWWHLLFGVIPLFSVNYAGDSYSHFLYLTTTNAYTNFGDVRILRYSGFFDESGAFSLYSFFALLLNRLYLKNGRIEFGLILCTIFSFSLGYFVSLVAYMSLFYVNKSNFYKLLIVCLLLLGIGCYIDSNKDASPTLRTISKLTVDRLSETEDGELKGNSRLEHTNHDKEVFKSNPFFGAGANSVSGSNIYAILGHYGILGSVLYYSPLIILLLRICKLPTLQRKEGLCVFILLSINLFHRPDISSVLSMVIIFCFLYYYTVQRTKQSLVAIG